MNQDFPGAHPPAPRPSKRKNCLPGTPAPVANSGAAWKNTPAKPEFREMVEREFPRQSMGWSEDEDPVEGRRNFLKLMGASSRSPA